MATTAPHPTDPIPELGSPLTYADLRDMPEDGNRYEIIDGEPVVSPAPSLTHAEVVARLFFLIRAFVLQHRPGGRVFTAPVDVRFTDTRVVEPDILYVAHDRQHLLADPALIDGAPDLVVEVVSPSRRRYDAEVKRRVYAEAGVREYWLADPARGDLTIFALEAGAFVPLPAEGGLAYSRLLPGLTVDPRELFADLP
jgi:Uma2 family endonuclease